MRSLHGVSAENGEDTRSRPEGPPSWPPPWPFDQVRKLCYDQPVWLAGGLVRDLFLERSPQDWDFACQGDALRLSRRVADAMGGAFYPLDPQRGTGRVLIKATDCAPMLTLDFAALRAPEIEGDLRLRDFTINAMAMTFGGALIDPTNGLVDLQAGLVRMTSPDAFRQDPVRLLRATRQAAELGFTVTPATRRCLERDAAHIAAAAPERVRAELVKLMRLGNAGDAVQDLQELGLLAEILPELYRPPPETRPVQERSVGAPCQPARRVASLVRHVTWVLDAVTAGVADPHRVADRHCVAGRHRVAGAAAIAGVPDPTDVPRPIAKLATALAGTEQALRDHLSEHVDAEVTHRDLLPWVALLLRTDGPGTAMTRLRFSRAAAGYVEACVAGLPLVEALANGPLDGRHIHRYYRQVGCAGVGLVLVAVADAVAQPNLTDLTSFDAARVAARVVEAYLLERSELVNPPALVTGRDLMALGVPEGPEVGRLVAQLREAQAAGEIHTRQDALAWLQQAIA